MPDVAPRDIDETLAQFLRGRRSIIAATRDGAHRPHLMRAVGFRLAATLERATLLLASSQSAPLLNGMRASRYIAVAFKVFIQQSLTKP
jgi:hypothetical protein